MHWRRAARLLSSTDNTNHVAVTLHPRITVLGLTLSLSFIVSVLPTSSSINAPKAEPRGLKRSRSPEQIDNIPLNNVGDDGMWAPRARLAVPVGHGSRIDPGGIYRITLECY